MTKKNNFVEGKPEKSILEGRDKALPKPALISRVSTSPIDDFLCNEELELKPVEKKSLVPERRQEKVTGVRFEFGRGWKGDNKKTAVREVESVDKIKGKKNYERELKEFEAQCKNINDEGNTEFQEKSLRMQEEYSVQPGFLERQHNKPNIWWSRAVLVDWMRHVCY